MSYQRWTEGDAYVIGWAMADGTPGFWCVSCSHHKTYRDIIAHLETDHTDSARALERLRREADIAGYDRTWDDYLALEDQITP